MHLPLTKTVHVFSEVRFLNKTMLTLFAFKIFIAAFQENKGKVQEHGYALRSQSSTGSVPDMPFDSDRMELFVAWDKAKDHADELAERAAEIHM